MTQSEKLASDQDPFAFLGGGGEMGQLIRSMDWSKTSLGPVAEWPQSLRTTISICLASDLPICVIWGPGLVQLYNDGYRVICGDKHPRSMGQRFADCWQEAWPVIGEAHDSAMAGDTAFLESQHIFLERHGYLEECFFTFSFSPIRDETGQVGGLFHPVIEMTTKMLGERRTRALRDLAARTSNAKSVSEALALTAESLAEYDLDLPFVLLYEVDPNGHQARLVASTGLNTDTLASPSTVDFGAWDSTIWPLEQVARSESAVEVGDIARHAGRAPNRPYPESPDAALTLPITPPGADRPAAVLIAGVSPRLPMNDAYRGFYDLLASGVTTAVASAHAYDEERRRAEVLAELDRAKTAFFSNVSHEFRTPLTLMLGPVDDILTHNPTDLSPAVAAQLDVVNRNGLRLLRLVNTLLDFSRIEAGRVRATYQPTDLATFTAELSSVFRSACERAGLTLRVDCPPLAAPVYVDREMWEKIVLNLLSNAFKFTLEGEIAVTLRQNEVAAELVVQDTGTGVPVEEMPRLFERFHRVENAGGRTHEGSGIGLALVQELVKLHGGTIGAESVVGNGTTFTVSLPLGSAHLPSDQIGPDRSFALARAGAVPYVEEALRWLPDNVNGEGGSSSGAPVSHNSPSLPSEQVAGDDRPRVLVADDNADMRQYVERLLSENFAVEVVPDGEAALAAAQERTPDLILTDVMMPRLDGFGLLRALRAEPLTRHVPVIMLSARAGEESRVEGVEAGADDYLVKPFSARELLARVTAQLQLARMRREADEALRKSVAGIRAFADAAPAMLWETDPAGNCTFLSQEWYSFTGQTEAEALGLGWTQATHPDDRPEAGRVFMAANARRSEIRLEYRLRSHDGGYRWALDIGRPRFAATGEYLGMVGVVIDIDDRKRADKDRERLVAQLREEKQRKDEFLATLAHELRNPLAPLRNGLQVMKLASNNGEVVEKSRAMMERQLGHMVRLIDDLLDLSRITRGTLSLTKERVHLAAVVQSAVETSRPLIDTMGHELTIALPPEPIFVNADHTRLAQVFANLLNNASKYTERGGHIRLSVELQECDAVVTVADSGVGIPAHMLPKVFEMFTQVDRSLDRAQGGLGIGLSLVQRMVELHGGSVEAQSDGDGMGSTFVVRLPVVPALAGEPCGEDAADPVRPTSCLRILVVDDNRDSATSLAMLLTLMGHETQTAHDGLEALSVAGAFRPDVALLDLGMPNLNGYDMARRIREQAWGGEVVLVACTGWGTEDDRRRTQEAGFDFHMVKPVDPVALEKLLAGLHVGAA